MELRVPFVTLLKIALAVLLAVIVIKLWPVILMLIIAVVIAVLLDPVVLWLEVHRVRQTIAVLAVAFVVFGLLVAFLVAPIAAGAASRPRHRGTRSAGAIRHPLRMREP